jgi:competence protein ComEA
MTSRQRGATWLLALVLAGRLLDALDLPFEKPVDPPDLHRSSAADSASPAALEPRTPRPDSLAAQARVDEGAAVGPLAINKASARELQALPRVGPVLAARIVAWREANGPFRSMRDLRRVQGIGARTAAQLAPLVRFD